ncbi:MAG: LacI family DNA-binding transcriptional regulator, partial [Lachnospiraceae bacterium]|nr:LacI family DNA-binding transcriptional regulator [Lachnospiraceae bacterium]
MSISIKDVANLAGVSPSTVSRILSNKISVKDDTRERVMRAVSELNYKPNLAAQALRNRESKLLGLIIPNIERPFYPKVIKNIEELAHEKGYSLILFDSSESVEKEAEIL